MGSVVLSEMFIFLVCKLIDLTMEETSVIKEYPWDNFQREMTSN